MYTQITVESCQLNVFSWRWCTWSKWHRKTLFCCHHIHVRTERQTVCVLSETMEQPSTSSVIIHLSAAARSDIQLCSLILLKCFNTFLFYQELLTLITNAKRPCDCRVLCLRPKSSLCSCAHSISDMTSFGCRDQGRDSVCPVLWMLT